METDSIKVIEKEKVITYRVVESLILKGYYDPIFTNMNGS